MLINVNGKAVMESSYFDVVADSGRSGKTMWIHFDLPIMEDPTVEKIQEALANIRINIDIRDSPAAVRVDSSIYSLD